MAGLKHYSNYIRLFELQLQGVLQDMVGPADNLSSVFSESLMKLYHLKEEVSNDSNINHDIGSQLDEVINVLQRCITDMQFVDSKRQRIEHVADGLSGLNGLSQSENKRVQLSEWEELDLKVKSQYKMKREREIYNKYLQECQVQQDDDAYLAE